MALSAKPWSRLLVALALGGCGDGVGSSLHPETGATPDDLGELQPAPGPWHNLPIQEPCPALDGAGPFAPLEGPFIPLGTEAIGNRERCTSVLHPTAGARGMLLRITLNQWGYQPADLLVSRPDATILARLRGANAGSSVDVRLQAAGEVLVVLGPSGEDADGHPYSLAVECLEACDTPYTRYPIVLMHGMGVTDTFFGVVDSFVSVKATLEEQGYQVLLPSVDPFAGTPERSAQWAQVLNEHLAQGYARRFNLLAHSQGGLDARFLVAGLAYGPVIASITTLSTPHRGTAVADLMSGAVSEPSVSQALLDAAADLYAQLLGAGDQDISASVASLTTEQMTIFNEQFPDEPTVRYFSWTGHSCGPLDFSCQSIHNGEIVATYFLPTFTILDLQGQANDGLVAVESARWGEFLGELPGDHGDVVGISTDLIPSFDHLAFFTGEARRLFDQGL